MRNLIVAFLVYVFVQYANGNYSLTRVVVISLIYIIMYEIWHSDSFKFQRELLRIKKEKKVEVWRINRSIKKRIKEDKKRVKEVMNFPEKQNKK